MRMAESWLQHTATHCNSCDNTLQHTATHCNTLQHTATHVIYMIMYVTIRSCTYLYNHRYIYIIHYISTRSCIYLYGPAYIYTQGSEDSQDALSLYVISRKRALYLGALLQRITCNLRNPMGLRHPVSTWSCIYLYGQGYICMTMCVSIWSRQYLYGHGYTYMIM